MSVTPRARSGQHIYAATDVRNAVIPHRDALAAVRSLNRDPQAKVAVIFGATAALRRLD